MTTTSVSTELLNRAGNKRGLHPNCRKNLRPGNPPVDAHLTGYSVTAEIKDILRGKERRHRIAETIVSESEAGNVPMIRELLDRTEGKVPEPTKAQPEQGTRIINIFVGTDKAKEMVEGLTSRLLQQANSEET